MTKVNHRPGVTAAEENARGMIRMGTAYSGQFVELVCLLLTREERVAYLEARERKGLGMRSEHGTL